MKRPYSIGGDKVVMHLPTRLWERLDDAARERDTTVQALYVAAITHYLEELEREGQLDFDGAA